MLGALLVREWAGNRDRPDSATLACAAGRGELVVDNKGAALDFTPAGVLAGGGNAVAGLEAATATLRALYKPGSPKAEAAGLYIASAFDDALRVAIERSAPVSPVHVAEDVSVRDATWWARWLAGVRDASLAVCDAYWCVPSASRNAAGNGMVRLRLAASVVEALKWAACDRFNPDELLWHRLAALFMDDREACAAALVAGDVPGVAREYVRAVAYHSANLDQFDLETAIVLIHVIDLCLPFVSLSRTPARFPQYVVRPELGQPPVRQSGVRDAAALYFTPWSADELLADFEAQLVAGKVPAALGRLPGGTVLAAIRYLRRQWSTRPPLRLRRRYPQDADLEVARGLDQCRSVLGGSRPTLVRAWKARDFSRDGLYVLASIDPSGAWPDIGELLGVHFVDGEGWQLAIVQRLRMWPDQAGLGLELLARKPTLVTVDDGQCSVDAVLCDVPQQGEAVRLVLPPGSLAAAEPVFMKLDGSVYKLRLLEAERVESDYQLSAFQVL